MSDYYSRNSAEFIDGSPIFKTPEDERNEHDIADLINKQWRCDVRSLGKLAPIDWVFVRDGRLVGVGELKSRTHKRNKYPTVFLNLRKWLALSLATSGLGVPAVFVVKFTDQICWINIKYVDASKIKIGGCRSMVKSRNDVEPVIEVPCDTMMQLLV